MDYPNLDMNVVHIPRCAGNSFKVYLMSLYGLTQTENLIPWSARSPYPASQRQNTNNPGLDHFRFAEIMIKGELKAHAESWDCVRYDDKILFDNESVANADFGRNNYRWPEVNFDLIYGHFTIDKWKHLNKRNIVWLRDPLKRAISEWKFTILSQRYWFGVDYDSPEEIDGIGRMVFKEKMDVNDVINSDVMVDVLSQYVGDDLSAFDFVGRVENFNNDLIRFQNMFGLKRKSIDKTNRFDNFSGLIDGHCDFCYERNMILSQPIDKERFYKTHQRDYGLYNA